MNLLSRPRSAVVVSPRDDLALVTTVGSSLEATPECAALVLGQYVLRALLSRHGTAEGVS